MTAYVILCVDDEREVLDALAADLTPFEKLGFRLELASSVAEARQITDALSEDQLALVLCDHLMPGELGVDYLVSLSRRAESRRARKVLVTGQAGLQDTIKAVNEAGLDHYIAKPWSAEPLRLVVRRLLTDFVLDVDPAPQRFAHGLDFGRIMEAIRDNL
jgi:DNA-binding NtrC family response regulator